MKNYVAVLSVGLIVAACAQQPPPPAASIPADAPINRISQQCWNSYRLSECTNWERMILRAARLAP